MGELGIKTIKGGQATLQRVKQSSLSPFIAPDNGQITAKVDLPSRNPPHAVLLRFRHPKAAPIRSVTVNGKPWSAFNTEKEFVRLEGFNGTVTVRANY